MPADLGLPEGWALPAAPSRASGAQAGPAPALRPSRRQWLQACPEVARVLRAAPDAAAWVRLVHDIVGHRQPAIDCTNEAAFTAAIERHMRAAGSLRGGQLASYATVWYAVHEALGKPQHWRDVLQWLQGFPGLFCHPLSLEKVTEPGHARKVKGVQASMRQEGLCSQQVAAKLQRPHPPEMLFSNRLGSAEDEEFAAQEVAVNVRRGSVLEWPFPGFRPWVVLSLAVARNSVGKRRLVLDARYVNLWLRYLPFSFETIADVVRQGEHGAFMTTWDLKAGYHHLLMAPEMWSLLGFQLRGKFYVFSCLPFGLSQAPYVFTRVMRCAHEWSCLQRHRLVSMIDDACVVHPNRESAAAQTCAAVWVEAALGFEHARPKCHLWPQQRQEFLGFVVDWAAEQLQVPERKLVRLQQFAGQLGETWDEQVLRSALGLLASCIPALRLAPLLGKWLRSAADEHVDSEDSAAVQFVAANLRSLNGRAMLQRHAVLELNAEQALQRSVARSSAGRLVLACDASDSAFGAFVSGSQRWRMVYELADSEVQAQLSSTVREIRGFAAAVRGLAESGRLRRGLVVQIWTDSQAAYACCVRMRGNVSVFPEVRALYLAAWAAGVELTFVWVPREHAMLRAADDLSKWQDTSDWMLSRTFARQQLFGLMGYPDIDCLASKHAHMCPVYYSAVYDGECAAVDGMLQPWDCWPVRVPQPGKPLCWVFPPVKLVPAVLRKIHLEKAEAIVILPRDETPETCDCLKVLPVRHRQDLCGPHQAMVVPTHRVPAHAAMGGWKMPLQAVRIAW